MLRRPGDSRPDNVCRPIDVDKLSLLLLLLCISRCLVLLQLQPWPCLPARVLHQQLYHSASLLAAGPGLNGGLLWRCAVHKHMVAHTLMPLLLCTGHGDAWCWTCCGLALGHACAGHLHITSKSTCGARAACMHAHIHNLPRATSTRHLQAVATSANSHLTQCMLHLQ